MERKDWTLLLLAAAGGAPLTPAQLQKTAFILGQERSKDVGNNYYGFVHYDYGAFSVDVYQDAEELEQDGYAEIQPNIYGRWKEYRATPSGLSHAKEIQKTIKPDVVKFITDTVMWARTKSFQELVREMYRRYPDTKENSVFQD